MECTEGALDHRQIVDVEVATLSLTGSPRASGHCPEHVQSLAAAQNPLPPIIVHRATMRVIDGFHRVMAAISKGESRIAAVFFDGSEEDAFALAVQANVTHGLPLALADRKRAARRIIHAHPEWSDRRIASVTGIAPGTVAGIRRTIAPPLDARSSRTGRDGRRHPMDSTEGRGIASRLIAENPDLSLRQVARRAGISPETVRDVRNRMSRGEDPVVRRPGNASVGTGGPPPASRTRRAGSAAPRGPEVQPDVRLIERLRADPSLRLTEPGRSLLRLLNLNLIATAEWEKIIDNVPPHCRSAVSRLARNCAETWMLLAAQMERPDR